MQNDKSKFKTEFKETDITDYSLPNDIFNL